MKSQPFIHWLVMTKTKKYTYRMLPCVYEENHRVNPKRTVA
jgi:hypothetical protein